jgi:hypothetical protein
LSPHFRNINCGHTNRWRKCGVKSCRSSKLNFRTSLILSRIPTNLNPDPTKSSEINFEGPQLQFHNFFSLHFHNRLRKCGYAVTEQNFFKKLWTCSCRLRKKMPLCVGCCRATFLQNVADMRSQKSSLQVVEGDCRQKKKLGVPTSGFPLQ